MTPRELAIATIGDRIELRDKHGVITRCTPNWFMVKWGEDDHEIIKRVFGIKTSRLTYHAQ